MRPNPLLLLALSACASIESPPVDGEPGAPLPGLTEEQLSRFREGRALFGRAFTPEEGLGPIFNQARCVSCHDLPESGGHGAEPVTKISHFDPDTGCDPLTRVGGSLLQTVVTPAMREAGFQPERTPAEASGITMMFPPQLFGLGLVEAVPEEAILSRADPEDVDGDGISGRPGLDPEGRPARFGLRATHATLDSFIEEAIRVEMGLTTPEHPDELLPNGEPLPAGMDPAPDPEVSDSVIGLLTDYVRFLVPVQLATPSDPVGEEIFRDIGCAACHTPTMTTGPSDNPALDRKRFRIYSDLLLHDMGRELADICTPGSVPGEWRTTPLVGLGIRDQFLHHGLATDFSLVMEMHGGEASAARDAYNRLTPARKQRLAIFLKSL
ncbi:MAG: hypothetical protein OXU69_12525 [Gemmatimonadota bacterium]|nr:hypothetical protein [Gemmatimonadota bacterium]MDE2985523.1 hypothetical protein [Gemmatimonadota bacterium]